MQKLFINQIHSLLKYDHVDNKIIDLIVYRIRSSPLLTRASNPVDHFCSFFVPIHKTSRSMYLGHHIKAKDWIPPGGHIRSGESPLGTLYREYSEELAIKLTNEPVILFDMSITKVKHHPKQKCVIHYDFWYLVYTDKINFKFDKGEFYDAGWFTFDQALKKTTFPQYRTMINKIKAFV